VDSSTSIERREWLGGSVFRPAEVIPQLYNVLVRRRLEFKFERVPYVAENLSLKKIANLFLHGLNQYLRPSRPPGVPVIAQVEPINTCDLSCPLCLTTSVTPSRTKAVMDFETFKKFIDDVGDYLLLIVLWGWGEPFLNRDIFQMIEYARKRDILIHCSTHGSLRKFDEAKAERLVASGLDTFIVAVDGATQESYEKYRVGGDLELVHKNIRTIVRTKKKLGAATPRLVFRVVVTGKNEHELPLMRKMAEELGVDFFAWKSVRLSSALEVGQNEPFLPVDEKHLVRERDLGGGVSLQDDFKCMRPWKRFTLLAGGEVVSCEFDYKSAHSFGRLDEGASTLDIWRGQAAKAFRGTFNLGRNDYYLCKSCPYKGVYTEECTIEFRDFGDRP
jgi:radical SAM protein with 4Fe4S-binding SPASM domain